MSEHAQGATVRFTGGLDHGEHDAPGTVYEGIVNGATCYFGGVAYVPVHYAPSNHNLMVVSTNIVEVVRP